MRLLIMCVSALLLLLPGCFITTLTLGPRQDARVNPAYAGDWKVIDEDDAWLIVRIFNEQEYYVELQEQGRAPVRMAGWIVPVEGIDFAHLRELRSDGSPAADHVIVRVDVLRDRMTLEHLRSGFFEDIDSDEALRRHIAQNIKNPLMYLDEPIELQRVR